MKKIKQFIAWLIFSSKDPDKLGLTVKSVGAAIVTYVVFFSGLFHLNIGADDVTTLFDQIAGIVATLLLLISKITAIIGFLRKLVTTIKGTNKVIKAFNEEQ